MLPNEVSDREIRRLQYLEAMGVESYMPRRILPGALPSVTFDWPELDVVQPKNISAATVVHKSVLDKDALQKLQQDLEIPRGKMPAASNPQKNSVAVDMQSTKKSVSVLQFQFAIFQPAKALLVLVPAQHTDAVHLQLLKNILLAIAIKTDHLVPLDNFSWPPRVSGVTKINPALEAAQETLHALLEGYQKNKSIKNILVFAGVLAEKIFPAEAIENSLLKNLDILSLPDLQQMLEDSTYKKVAWQKIRFLTL